MQPPKYGNNWMLKDTEMFVAKLDNRPSDRRKALTVTVTGDQGTVLHMTSDEFFKTFKNVEPKDASV